MPVRFVGGLPVEGVDAPLAFPVGYGKQAFWIGKPLLSHALSPLPSAERKKVVLSAINGFGGRWRDEGPMSADPEFAAAVQSWQAERGVLETEAVHYRTFEGCSDPSEETGWLLEVLGQDAVTGQVGDAVRRWIEGFGRGVLGVGVKIPKALP